MFAWRYLVCFIAILSNWQLIAAEIDTFEGQKSEYRGYVRYDSSLDGRKTIVVVPRKVAIGRPWVWRAEFFDAFPQVDVALLEKGFHLVYIDVGNTFGCPDALQHWDAFYKYLVHRHQFSSKPVLEGLSRGGLYCFNWAANNADHVACILADNAVLDFKSWPKGRSAGDWKKLLNDYHFADEAEALAYRKNPVDNLEPLAHANVPIYLLCNDTDPIVPYKENGGIVKQRYDALGGQVVVQLKHHLGHHPHSTLDPTSVVDFIMKHTLPLGSPVVTAVDTHARPADLFVDSVGVNVHLDYLDTRYSKFAEIVKPRLQESGIRHIRDHVPLQDHDDQRAKLNELAQSGIRSLLICDPKSGSFDQILKSLKDVSSSVEAVEGPNEPDGENLRYKDQSFPESARVFQEELMAALKLDFGTRLLPFVPSAMSNPENAPKLATFGNTVGFANTHSYADGGPPGYQWDWYMERCRTNSQGTVLATETGYHNSIHHTDGLWIPGVSVLAAGKYVSRLFPEYFSRSISRTYLYELLDERNDSLNAENNFGILYADGQPKPAFQAIKNMIALLADPGPSHSPASLRFNIVSENAQVHHLLLQKRNGQFSLLLWQNTVAFDTKSQQDVEVKPQKTIVELLATAKDVKSYLPLQSSDPVQKIADGKQLQVEVPDQLLILQFTME